MWHTRVLYIVWHTHVLFTFVSHIRLEYCDTLMPRLLVCDTHTTRIHVWRTHVSNIVWHTHVSFICVTHTRHIHMCDTHICDIMCNTHIYVYMCDTHMFWILCDAHVFRLYVWHYTRHVYMCETHMSFIMCKTHMSRSHVWHTHVSCNEWHTRVVYMCDTHTSRISCDTHMFRIYVWQTYVTFTRVTLGTCVNCRDLKEVWRWSKKELSASADALCCIAFGALLLGVLVHSWRPCLDPFLRCCLGWASANSLSLPAVQQSNSDVDWWISSSSLLDTSIVAR